MHQRHLLLLLDQLGLLELVHMAHFVLVPMVQHAVLPRTLTELDGPIAHVLACARERGREGGGTHPATIRTEEPMPSERTRTHNAPSSSKVRVVRASLFICKHVTDASVCVGWLVGRGAAPFISRRARLKSCGSLKDTNPKPRVLPVRLSIIICPSPLMSTGTGILSTRVPNRRRHAHANATTHRQTQTHLHRQTDSHTDAAAPWP
jgi:hypothetical protein